MAVTLVVEDGTGLVNANAYVAVSFVDTYHEDRFNCEWKGTADQKASAILRATEHIDRAYRFQGCTTHPETPQALSFPRTDIYTDEYVLVDPDSVPIEVQQATAELALSILSGAELLPSTQDSSVKTRRERVGVVEMELDFDIDEGHTSFPRVDLILVPLLAAHTFGGGSASLLRG